MIVVARRYIYKYHIHMTVRPERCWAIKLLETLACTHLQNMDGCVRVDPTEMTI